MKKESLDCILRAYDEAFSLLGFESFPQGVIFICSRMETYLKQLRHARSRAGVEAMLTKEPEPDPQKLDAMVKAIRLLPYQLRKALPQASKEATQKLPRPPGGRPRRLTPDKRRIACKKIGELYTKGVSLLDAEKRVAQQMNVSVRTVQRAWQKRAERSFARTTVE